MKTSTLLTLAALTTGILATPAGTSPNNKRFPQLVERAPCYHSSDCSWFYGAQCEQYCRKWGQNVGVARMEKCNLLNMKRCCCTA